MMLEVLIVVGVVIVVDLLLLRRFPVLTERKIQLYRNRTRRRVPEKPQQAARKYRKPGLVSPPSPAVICCVLL